MVQTAVSVPPAYERLISIHINDMDLDIVARNLMLLLLSLIDADHEQAVECMIHLWYSAFVRERDLQFLETHIRPLFQDVITKIANKDSNTTQAKTWKFQTCSLRVELTKLNWDQLLYFLEVPHHLSFQRARELRSRIVLAEHRVDYRDRIMAKQPLGMRVCQQRYLEEGVLLPFGASRDEFDKPNPFVPPPSCV